MTEAQVRWAAQHDWFIMAQEQSDHYVVIARGELDEPKEVRFDDYRELRAWAGY